MRGEHDACVLDGLVVANFHDAAAGEVRLALDADGVWRHLSDREHVSWTNLPLLKRLDRMGVCPNGLLDPSVSPEVRAASEIVGLEGLTESYHVLPRAGGLLSQPAGLLEAFSLVREVKNMIQARRMKEMQDKAKPLPTRGA